MLDYEFLYIISVPLYVVFLGLHLKKRAGVRNIVLNSLLYFYIVAVISITLFPLPVQQELINDSTGDSFLKNNYIPFRSIYDIAAHNSFSVAARQIAGNIVLLIPLGFLAPFVWHGKNSFSKVFPIGFLFSFGIELTQFLISMFLGFTYKVSDVDDIILNTSGFALGYLLYKMFRLGTK